MESLEARLARLEEAFLLSRGGVKPYLIWDIFEKINTNNVIKNWVWDLPATTAVWSNNQIGKYIDREWATILKEVFSATANGFWRVFFQPNEFTVLQDSYAFTFKKPVKNIKLLQMYFVAILNKIFSKYNWENKSWWNKIKEEIIHLPTLSNWELAYEYMESYIKEIEAYHIKEIEAYLKATGLSDYNLSKDEVESLKTISMGGGRKFRLDELFEVKSNPQLDKRFFEFKEEGKYPYFTRTVLNNGIAWYVKYLDDEHLAKGNCLAVGMLWMQFFYMKQDFYSWQFTKSLFPKFKGFNSTLAQFFISFLNKKSKDFQSVLIRDFVKEFNNTEITLPVNANNQIDYPLIETYIKATQKLVIKDLVDRIKEKLEIYFLAIKS